MKKWLPHATFALATIGVVTSLVCFKKVKALNDKVHDRIATQRKGLFLSWQDVENYVEMTAQKVKEDQFSPNCILVTCNNDAILASLVSREFVENISIAICPILASSLSDEIEKDDYYTKLKLTDKYCIFMPNALPISNNDKILILRSHSESGNGFGKAIENLETRGFAKDNIKTACISCSESRRWNLPNYYCFEATNTWFPWGKGS
jgi:hypoxanthine phosphoribosyltransferase